MIGATIRALWNAGAVAGALALCPAVRADTPLAPPADYTRTTDAGTMTGTVATGEIKVTRQTGPFPRTWTIPVWANWVMLSPNGTAALVLHPGGNLISSRDSAQIVATAWYQDGAEVGQRAVPLGEVMDPANMPQSASHFPWLCGWDTGATGWALSLCDGRTVTIPYR